MRRLLFTMIMLTSLDGTPVWVESSQIIVIRPQREMGGECKEGTGAAIRIGAKGLCVRETPDEIREKIRNAD